MKANLPKEYRSAGNGSLRSKKALQKLRDTQKEIETKSEELDKKEYSASSGGGAVTVTVTGDKEVTSIKMSQEIIKEANDEKDSSMLEDMIIAAINEALKTARTEKENMMNELSGELNLDALLHAV